MPQHDIIPSAEQLAWDDFRKGDRNAFASLYHFHIQPLIAYGMRVTGEQQVVKDVIQDLFVEQQRLILSQLSSASAILQGDFNPDKPNPRDLELFRERVMQLMASLTIQEDFAKRLAANYAEALKY